MKQYVRATYLLAVTIPARTVAAMLATVREAALAEDHPRAIVSALHSVIDVDYVTYDEFGPRGAITIAEPDSPSAVEAFDRHAHEHPSLVDYRRTGRRVTRRLSDLITQRQLRNLGLWADVFRPLGIRYQLNLAVHASGPWLIGIGLSRTGRDFTDEERLVAELLRIELGHVVAAREGPPPEQLEQAGLTAREAEVLSLATHRTNAEVARVLHLSERTVAKHLEHAYAKLGVSTRQEALAVALSAGRDRP